jgi:hypothetical protein
MGMQPGRKHQVRAAAAVVERMNPLLPGEHPDRPRRAIRGLASDPTFDGLVVR